MFSVHHWFFMMLAALSMAIMLAYAWAEFLSIRPVLRAGSPRQALRRAARGLGLSVVLFVAALLSDSAGVLTRRSHEAAIWPALLIAKFGWVLFVNVALEAARVWRRELG